MITFSAEEVKKQFPIAWEKILEEMRGSEYSPYDLKFRREPRGLTAKGAPFGQNVAVWDGTDWRY